MWTIRCAAFAFAAAGACSEEGSLGEYPESSGTAADDGVTTGTDATETESASSTGSADSSGGGMSSDGTTTTDPSETTSADGSGSSSDTGSEVCTGKGNCHVFSPCGRDCGTLDSPFDENGCLREACEGDDDCAADERCYVAMNFGGCASSGFLCEDDFQTETCACVSLPDCGGAYCVPQDVYPAGGALPDTEVVAEAACAPDDGEAIRVHWAGPGACGLAGETALELTFYDGPFAVDTFAFGGFITGFGSYRLSDDTLIEVEYAELEITAFDGDVWSGRVEASFGPNVDGLGYVEGDLVDVQYCGNNPMCG
jgi:hypothetical protein